MRFYTNVKQIGNNIYVRGYDNGVHFKDCVDFGPTLFVKSKIPTEYKTLKGESVSPIKPGTLKDTREFLDKYKNIDGFEIYGNVDSIYQYISESYPDEIEFDINKIKLVTIDIETTAYAGVDVQSANEEILLITLQDYSTKQTYTWGSRQFSEKVENNTYFECADEKDLLSRFLEFWENDYPEVITGHNVKFFDIPYIIKRIDKTLGPGQSKRFSIWGKVLEKRTEINNREEFYYDVYGISTLDFLELYRKYSLHKPENYRLDTIAYDELKERKLDHTEYETFNDFFMNDWSLFTKYNIKDTELVDKLEDKLRLIEMAIAFAYQSKTNYEDVFFQVRMWDAIIYNHLKQKNIVVPPKKVADKPDKFIGAYVKVPTPGKYGYTVSLDLQSLYPHIIMGVNVSPETLIDERFDEASIEGFLNQTVDISGCSYSIAPNGAMFRKDIKGFLPEILEQMFNKRKFFKDKMIEYQKKYEKEKNDDLKKQISKYKVMQNSLKTCLNSGYGAMGSNYFRFYELANAEAITSTGQLAIRWIGNKLNAYFNKLLKTQDFDFVIYSDTDSAFLNMQPLVDKIFSGKNPTKVEVIDFLDKIFATTIQEYIDKCYRELAEYMNSYAHKLFMKREKIADSFIIPAKKRYIVNVWDNEGVRFSEPQLSITGIEAIKSSTPAFCRDKIKQAFAILVSGTEDEMISYIELVRKEFKSLPPEDISTPTGVSDIEKHFSQHTIYKKGTGVGVPIHVRGSLLYNHHIKKNRLSTKYPFIRNGEKIKYCYLKLPNPIHENVIAFVQRFPRDLDLEKYVDYDAQFEKAFIQPLKTILDVVGWSIEKTNTLDSFFS
jgi:DNA polymerase elongation subunit (family B)